MTMKSKIIISSIVTIVLLFIVATVTKASNQVQLQQVDIKTKSQEIQVKTQRANELQKQLEDAHGDLQKLKNIEEENKKLQEDIKALQAVKAEKARIASLKQKSLAEKAVNTLTGTKTAYAATGDSSIDCKSISNAKAFIYCKESGNSTAAINGGGCRGLGQACPGTKLPCGNDYACQDAYFTNYMKQRYGSWEKAKAFWLARVPIKGKDVGHWW